MSRQLHFLGISGLTICAAACGFPRPPDISPDSRTPPASEFPASNSVTRADLAPGIAPLVVPAGATFVIDTDHGSMFDVGNANAPIRVAGSGVQDGVFYRTDDQNRAFFAVQSLLVGDGAILRGVGTRALILVADGTVEIHGILDVSAGHCSSTTDGAGCPGPGGSAPGDGCSPGKRAMIVTAAAGGGGGGGFASPGGAGSGVTSSTSPSVMGGAGGSGMGCLGLDPLHGGSGGAIAGDRPGSAGGGAVQLTSYTSIALMSPNVANTSGAWAGGAGGGGGMPGGSGPFAGGGGGAGGGILLEAPTIDIRPGAVLAANGGGGGAGAAPVDGQPGQFGSQPASGGASSGAAGGTGGALNANAMDGAPGVMTQQSSPAGGGGGGGIGRIHINAITSNVSDQAVLSPAPSMTILPAS